MTHRAFLLRAALLALVTPAACGSTADPDPGVAGGAAGAGSRFPCTSSMAVMIGDQPTGLESCGNGSRRRVAAVTCPSLLPRAAACSSPGGSSPQCKTDQDCTVMPHGRCDVPSSFSMPSSCSCSYGCTTDAECGQGEICLCGDPVGTCVPSNCTTNADCPAGACLRGFSQGACDSTEQFACQTDADECAVDTDCPASMRQCAVVNARRVCVSQPVCGRPLLVGATLRLAPLAAGGGWG